VELLYVCRVGLALSVFLIASTQDLRDRQVSDLLWLISGAGAIIILALQILLDSADFHPQEIALLPLPSLLFADMFLDWRQLLGRKGEGLRFTLIALFALPPLYFVYEYPGLDVLVLASIPLWIFFLFVLYHFNVIRGGADVKGLVVLSILFPFYPPAVFGVRQLQLEALTFPFFLNVLLIAALLAVVVPLALIVLNLMRGDIVVPNIFTGFRKDVGSVDLDREWLMEIPDDEGYPVRIRKLGSIDERMELARIRKLNWARIWVSPKIPLLVFLTAGLLLSLLFGSISSYF